MRFHELVTTEAFKAGEYSITRPGMEARISAEVYSESSTYFLWSPWPEVEGMDPSSHTVSAEDLEHNDWEIVR